MSTTDDLSRVGDELRAALQYSTGDERSDAYIRGTLRAGIVGNDPVLIDIYEQEAGPEQAEVDLHLEGEGVTDHSTNAHDFAAFVSGISEAVKETAKGRAGKGRYTEGLLIEGATPGSVRVVLRAPTPRIQKNQTADERTLASTIDSDALRTIAAIMTHASDTDPDSPFAAELAGLPIKARKGLKRAVKQSRKAGWVIGGTVRQRKIGAAQVQLTSFGAIRLSIELDSGVERVTTETAVGRIDGFRRSLGTLYFIPAGGKGITAGVTDSEVAAKVTDLFADPDAEVEAVFSVVERQLPSSTSAVSRSRVLTSIRQLHTGKQTALPNPMEP